MNESLLSVKDASGKQVSLLNEGHLTQEWSLQNNVQAVSKRKYQCSEPGCNKTFTTSGHLARHNRIHTGEKNFPCLFPGCQSRFSRQDNMMQHYRTHMSPKSKRAQKRSLVDDTTPKPKLHAHHRIRLDPVRVDPPLTIDQHLSNYHESLIKTNTVHDNLYFPPPLSSIARSSSKRPSITSSPTLSPSSSPSTHSLALDEEHVFFQHRPLRWTNVPNHLPYTLLHPKGQEETEDLSNVVPNQTSGNASPDNTQDPMEEEEKEKSPSSNGLLQLAHIVSTFG